ncbi:MAG: hypothetical protein IIA87_01475 [Nanoarchaeota archaeon]|nr:hypothetical protein [Nanoarchaeota archaeon]
MANSLRRMVNIDRRLRSAENRLYEDKERAEKNLQAADKNSTNWYWLIRTTDLQNMLKSNGSDRIDDGVFDKLINLRERSNVSWGEFIPADYPAGMPTSVSGLAHSYVKQMLERKMGERDYNFLAKLGEEDYHALASHFFDSKGMSNPLEAMEVSTLTFNI